MAAEGMQSHDQSRGNCPTASHPATKKGRINAPILPKPARCAKSDRLLVRRTFCVAADIQQIIGRRVFLGGRCPMLDAWNRAEHYRDLAEECRRLAVTSFSTQMRNRFWRMA